MTQIHEGGCFCGQVRYRATGAPVNIRACHCRMCQKATGQPFNARVLYRQADITVTGQVARFASSDALDRGFCPTCGTTLFSIRDAQALIGVTMGTFDDPAGLAPTQHIWLESKQPWVCVEDGVEMFEGPPP